jgi:CheY-like chemotaxis protein
MLATRILYVEDDAEMRESLGHLLTLQGYDVTPVDSAEAAIEALGASAYDVLLTDYRLPNQHADWLVARVAEMGFLEPARVIVLTGESGPKGVEGYRTLRKPADVDELLAVIARALEAEPTPLAPDDDLGLPSADEPLIELVLYVRGDSATSRTALRNLQRALRSLSPDEVKVTVCDVDAPPDTVRCREAKEDRIVVTPTLVRRRPLPKRWIAGDLSEPGALDELLHAANSRS